MNNGTEQVYLLNSIQSHPLGLAQKQVPTHGTTSVNLENVENFSNVCRICATITQLVIPIFTGEGLEHHLAEKIHKHLPINVSETDLLPLVVCYQCVSTLLAWHELVVCCMQADRALKAKIGIDPGTETRKEAQRITLAPSTTTEEDSQSKSYYGMVRNVLVKYFHQLTLEEHLDTEFVCQMCIEKPALTTVESLADHMKYDHSSHSKDEAAIKTFIKNYVTFEEVLVFDDYDKCGPESTEIIEKPLPNLFCPYCASVFSSATRLVCHLNKHFQVTIEDGVTCCGIVYNDKKNFVIHLQENHVERKRDGLEKVCKCCGLEAEDASELQAHISDAHQTKELCKTKTLQSPKNQKYIPAVCPECNKTFANKYSMFLHMKNHNAQVRTYSCDKCKKSYKNRATLNSHIKIVHEGILNFLCSECGEAFPTRTARDVHSRLHTGDKPYTCKHCGKSYRAKNTLDSHLEIHLDIRKYKCEICSKRFRKKTHLNYHVTTHSKLNKISNYLRPPELQELGDPPQYTVPHQLCDFCNVSYPEDTFIKHLIVEHSELLFHCEQCDKYLNRRQFIAHMSLHAVQYTDRSELEKNMRGENNGTQNNNTVEPVPNHDADGGSETRNSQSLTNTEQALFRRDASTIISITSNQNVNITPTVAPQNISVDAPKTNANARDAATRNKITKPSIKRNKSQKITTVTTPTSNIESKGTTAIAENKKMNASQATNTHQDVADPIISLRHNQTANNAPVIRNQNTNTKAPVTRSQNITTATAKLDTTSLPQNNKTTKHSQENEFSDHSDMEYGFGPLPESVFEAIEDTQNSQEAEDASQVVDIEYIDDESNSATKDCNFKLPASKKPRTCPICSKVYKASSSYFYHLKHTHKKIKEHECEICAKKFATRASLASHIRTHTGDYQFECKHCKKRFRSNASLYIHEQIHTGIKAFSCEQCNTSFRWRTHLLRHMKRHSAEKSHVCSICGRGFSIRCDLLRHTRTHTAGEFSCEECDVKFAQMRYLKVHMNKKHSKTDMKT